MTVAAQSKAELFKAFSVAGILKKKEKELLLIDVHSQITAL